MVPLGPLDLYAAGASIVNGRCFRCGLSSDASSHRADGLGVVPWPFGGWFEDRRCNWTASCGEKKFIVLVVAVSAFRLDFGVP